MGIAYSHSSEFAPECSNAVISLLDSQREVTDKGGTMRLGAYPCRLQKGSKAAEIYGVPEVSERHRHRYEVSNRYRDAFVEHGMRLSGLSPDSSLVEMIELPDHPWFVGCQFHPELQSRPLRPHPLFATFVEAAVQHQFPEKKTDPDSHESTHHPSNGAGSNGAARAGLNTAIRSDEARVTT